MFLRPNGFYVYDGIDVCMKVLANYTQTHTVFTALYTTNTKIGFLCPLHTYSVHTTVHSQAEVHRDGAQT